MGRCRSASARHRLNQHAAFNCSISTRCQERSRSDGYGEEENVLVSQELLKAAASENCGSFLAMSVQLDEAVGRVFDVAKCCWCFSPGEKRV